MYFLYNTFSEICLCVIHLGKSTNLEWFISSRSHQTMAELPKKLLKLMMPKMILTYIQVPDLFVSHVSVGYSPPQVGNMVAFSGWTSPRERSGSTGNDRCNVVDRERSSAYFKRSSNTIDTSPPVSLLYAQSPPNMEGPVAFVAPELLEETLMDVCNASCVQHNFNINNL